MIRRILAPVDLTAISAPLISLASDLARLAGCELIVLHVFTPEDYAEVQQDTAVPLDEYVGGLWATMRDQVRAAGGPDAVRLEVLQGWSVPEQILAAVRRWDVQMIVMGSRGRTGLRRLLLGSVAEEVLRHATCPVLVIPAAAQAVISMPAAAGAPAAERGREQT